MSTFFDENVNHNISYHRLDTYFIHGFKYSKKNWPMMDERDPYLLTIKGLKATFEMGKRDGKNELLPHPQEQLFYQIFYLTYCCKS